MRFRTLPFCLSLAAVLFTLPAVADQPNPTPQIAAVRLPEGTAVTIDGRLDEPCWLTAPPATGFRQQEPLEGEPATEETEVRILYNRNALIVGVLARDREPQKVIARILQRDKIIVQGMDNRYDVAGDDVVAILLDPFLDRKNAFVFAANPNGAEFDALITDESRNWNIDWRGVWRVAALRTTDGWSAEFEIPFRTLRYPDDNGREQLWGFNVLRVIRRKTEHTLWTSWTRAGGGFHRVSNAGVIRGLENLPRSGVNLELKPVGLLGAAQEEAASVEALAHAGLDLKWEVSPGLVLDLTLHPDFAQVESDEERVNLTRFDLFYPEKRDFFLENAGLFEFGTKGFFEPPPFLLFMSRSIGIRDEGEVPLIGGVRLSGRAGRQTIGFLDVAADRSDGLPRTNHTVFRYKRDIGRANYIGFAATDRRNSSGWNTAGGVDASFWPTPSVNVQAFAARTATQGEGGDDLAYRAAVEYSGDRFGFAGEHLVIGPEVNAEMGFVTRSDIRRTSGNGRYVYRPKKYGVRSITLFAIGSYVTRLNGRLQDYNAGQFLETEWESGESLALFTFQGFTRLDEEFSMSDAVPVPAGDYTTREWGGMASTSRKRPLSLRAMAMRQSTFGGHLQTVESGLTLAPSAHFSLQAGYSYSRVRLPNGGFDSRVGSVRLVFAFSSRLSVQTLVQYNSLERRMVANARLHFIHHPGSDLFIAVNEERDSAASLWTVGRRDAAVKVNYLFRL